MRTKDNPNIPEEIRIYYDRNRQYLTIFFFSLLLLYGIYRLFFNEEYYLGIFIIAVSTYILYETVQKSRDRTVQIILNAKGVQVAGHRFCGWSSVKKIAVFQRKTSKSIREYIHITYYKVDVEYDLEDLDTSFKQIQEQIEVYQFRHFRNKMEGR